MSGPGVGGGNSEKVGQLGRLLGVDLTHMEDPRCAAIAALVDGANLSRPHHHEHPRIEAT
jgi:hypothetical protein